MPRVLPASALLACFCLLAHIEAPVAAAAPPPVQPSELREIETLLQNGFPRAACERLQPLADKGDPSALFALGFLQDIGAGIVLNEAEALALLTRAAESGHATAAGYLAWKFEHGFLTRADPEKSARYRILSAGSDFSTTPVPGDWLGTSGRLFIPKLARAFLWLEHAASEGDAMAQYNLAHYHFEGRCSAPDHRLYLRLLSRSADQNFGPAASQLSLLFRHGLLVEADKEKARHYLRIAADGGLPGALYDLARELLQPGSHDTAEGLSLLKRAAALKHPQACLELGRRLRDGDGLPQDEVRALEVFERVAEVEEADVLDEIAYAYETGRGTARDLDHARKLLEKSATRGSSWAKHRLGMIALENPPDGTPAYATAIRWFEAAAAEGHVASMKELGRLHHEGLGVDADPAASFLWYERAARDGDSHAQARVAWCLLNGAGIERDDEEALTWSTLAAGQGNAEAGLLLAWLHLEGRGTAKNIPAALEQAFSVLRRHPDCQHRNDFFNMIASLRPEDRDEARKLILARWSALQDNPELSEELMISGLLMGGVEWLVDFPSVMTRLEQRAGENRLWALEMLSQLYFTGDQVARDYKASYAYARRAAALPEKAASVALGFHQIAGVACDIDEAGGIALLEAAAPESGYASYLLAQFRAMGLATPLDATRARQHLLHAASLHYQPAWNLLAAFDNDPERALAHFAPKPAAEPFDEKHFAETLADHLRTEADSSAIPFWRPRPDFPPRMRLLDRNGEATLRFELTPDGRTEKILVLNATHAEFAIAAIKAVRQWRFLPAIKDGQPVRIRMQMPVIFDLEEN